jgi:hypothetical protein
VFHGILDISKGNHIRIPGHHKLLFMPASQSVNSSDSSNHCPVPFRLLLKISLCVAKKLSGDSHLATARSSSSTEESVSVYQSKRHTTRLAPSKTLFDPRCRVETTSPLK